jgi:hypothetical protein
MSGDDLCYAKAKQRGQKTFTLVEQDRTSVEAIAYWILLNIRTAPREKLQQALDDCIQWREFSVQKEAD